MVDLDRRTYLGTVTAALVGAIGTAGVQSAAAENAAAVTDGSSQSERDATGQAGPWSQYRVGPANTGAAATRGPRANLEVDWEYTDVEYSGVRSGPAVVDGTLYFTSMASDLSEDGRVHAVDAADGSDLWQVETGWRDQATPAVADGRVFVGDGELLALDAANGDELWTGDEEVYGSVTVAGDAVYAAVYDGVVRAFDAATGDVEWTFDPARDGTDWSTVSTPAVVDGTVYATADAQQEDDEYQAVAYAIDAATGKLQWFSDLPPSANAGLDAGPAVTDGTVFVTLGGTLSALDAATGEVQWSTPSTVRPTVWDGTVFAVEGAESITGEESISVLALDAETGETQWQSAPEGDDVDQPTDLVVASGTLYFGTFDKGAFVFDAATGEQRDRVLHDQVADLRATPTVADGTVYLCTSDSGPTVYAFVDAGTPPTPEIELRLTRDPPYCVGEELTFVREASEPADSVDFGQEDYVWKTDFDANDGESGAFEDMSRTAGELARHTYEEPGTYEAAVVARDPYGRTVTDAVTVEVEDCDGPTAAIDLIPTSVDPSALERETEVLLDAGSSKAPAGIERYEWDVDGDGEFDESGDGVSLTIGENCTHESRTVTLRVTDAEGNRDEASITLSTVGA